MKFKKVWVVGGDHLIEQMFEARGIKPVGMGDDPDILCFTGGEDVTPSYYGEEALGDTYFNTERDEKEEAIFKQHLDTAKVGICRGGQFLNVMSGGAMWQHVDQHGLAGEHDLIDLVTQEIISVTSTHHQMMIAGDGGEVIAIANRATVFLSDKEREKPKFDTEVVYYEKTRSLCFQPHPEYVTKGHQCEEYFFELVEHLL